MQQPVEIEEVKVERQGPLFVYWYDDYILTYYITFTDKANEENFYFFKYDQAGDAIGSWMGNRDYTYEYVFQQLAHTVNASVPGWKPFSNSGLPFSDSGIDGQTHTLVVKEIIQNSPLSGIKKWSKLPREFKLYSISKSYYKYLVSLICNDTSEDGLHSGMIDFGLAEPLKIYSNVSGGLGIVATYTFTSKIIDVIEEVGAFPK